MSCFWHNEVAKSLTFGLQDYSTLYMSIQYIFNHLMVASDIDAKEPGIRKRNEIGFDGISQSSFFANSHVQPLLIPVRRVNW